VLLIISIGVHLNFDDAALKAVVNNCKMNCFIGNADAILKILRILQDCPSLELLVSMDPIPSELASPIPLINFQDLRNTPDFSIEFPSSPRELFSIKYTSGSTGNPKVKNNYR
jgi:long-subunit acyl-CoA synthetase (AMP-forming)